MDDILPIKHRSNMIMAGKKEILVPLTDEFIVEVNKDTKEFIVVTPDGLVNMYLNES